MTFELINYSSMNFVAFFLLFLSVWGLICVGMYKVGIMFGTRNRVKSGYLKDQDFQPGH
mgnify:CR=1 FL=1